MEKLIISKDVTVIANPKLISKITGNKKENIKYFKNKKGVNVTVVKNDHEDYYKIIQSESVK